MKKFLKITGYGFLAVLFVLYICFLFVLPKTIDLNKYKPELQKVVKENTDLKVDFDNVEVITSPFLEAGIKSKNIKVTLPDDTVLFSADFVKGKVFLPSLLWLTVRVSCAEVESPKLNVEIINSEKYKVAKVYEDLVNKKRAQSRLNPPTPEVSENVELPFDLSSIKVVVPAVKINNYSAVVDDVKANHKLTLKGEQIKLGYFNGKTVTLKTDAKLLSDANTNVTANLDISTFMPEIKPQQNDDNDEDVFELPFVNPVTEFRNYDLKSDISAKMKVRQDKKSKKIWAKGYLNIDNTTVNLSGLQLPESYFNLSADGYNMDIDTNFYVTEKEYINFLGKIGYGKNPYIDCAFKSTQIHFDNLLKISKAYLDTVHIKHDIDNMTANGYLYSNFKLKTDFEDIISDGKFIIRGGNIYDNNIGLIFNGINANVIFDNNAIKVDNTHVLVNQRPLEISGSVDTHSNANVDIFADRIPLTGLYLAFAPKEVKQSYKLSSGDLSLDAKLRGTIKKTSSIIKSNLDRLVVSDNAEKFILKNESAKFGLANTEGKITGKFKNEGFKISLPDTNSVIYDDLIIANLTNKTIEVDNSDLRLNDKSRITFNAKVKDYMTEADTKLTANGFLADSDLKTLIGDAAAPYLDSKGFIPLKLNFKSKGQKMKLVTQLQTDKNAYITPVKISELEGKNALFQLKLEKNGNSAKIYRSGIFVRRPNAPFNDKLHTNLIGVKEVVGLRAKVINLDTTPFISLFKLNIPKDLRGSICIFPKSNFTVGGNIYAYGEMNNPKINGRFNVRDLTIPEIYTKIRDISADLSSRDLRVAINDVDANGSDFNIKLQSAWKTLADMKIADIKVNSRLVDVDKILLVSEALMQSLPTAESSSASSEPADIPVEILGGIINLQKITTGNIIVDNTTGNISLFKNIFYLNNLKTSPLGGKVSGDVSMNLVTSELNAKVTGAEFDVNKILVDVMDMKDTLSGNMNFIADISMKGATQEEQMNSLIGYLDFNIKDGQLGPFGKFENFLMAENIRNNAFFSSTIGSVITKIVTFDTSRYNNLYGHLTFADGFADIAPIKSQGDVMSMYIAGKIGLLDNSADLKLRGKLGSAFSDSLGPLANINPVNLIKNTPGLNIVAAKTFSIFCESVSPEEMAALPSLAANKSDDYATKFQIVLRGDTRKPLKMIKSFKWLALQSDIESAQGFVDTMPIPEPGEEDMSVEELIQKREAQAAEAAAIQQAQEAEKLEKSVVTKIKKKFKKNK